MRRVHTPPDEESALVADETTSAIFAIPFAKREACDATDGGGEDGESTEEPPEFVAGSARFGFGCDVSDAEARLRRANSEPSAQARETWVK